MKKVLIFGTFDGLHPGHLHFIKQAKRYGDYLIAVVARDKNVKKLKGHLPKQPERIRLKNLQNLATVNKTILGYQNYAKRKNIINKIKPDIICLGYDQPQLKIENYKLKIIKLKPHYPKRYKSSLLPK